MRDRFAHHYREMDLKIIYNTAVEDIPVLYEFIKKEFKNSFPIDED